MWILQEDLMKCNPCIDRDEDRDEDRGDQCRAQRVVIRRWYALPTTCRGRWIDRRSSAEGPASAHILRSLSLRRYCSSCPYRARRRGYYCKTAPPLSLECMLSLLLFLLAGGRGKSHWKKIATGLINPLSKPPPLPQPTTPTFRASSSASHRYVVWLYWPGRTNFIAFSPYHWLRPLNLASNATSHLTKCKQPRMLFRRQCDTTKLVRCIIQTRDNILKKVVKFDFIQWGLIRCCHDLCCFFMSQIEIADVLAVC